MSEILSRPMVEALLRDRRRLPSSADLLWDCDAALRAENERLRRLFVEIRDTVRSPQEIAAEALGGAMQKEGGW